MKHLLTISSSGTDLVPVQISDAIGTVTISNDDSLPLITGPSGDSGDLTSSITINENSSFVHTFSANETVTWSLNGGDDFSKFAIDSSTGTLSFITAPDYESPTDSDSNNTYIVGVRAVDSASNLSDQTVTVSIADIDDPTYSISAELIVPKKVTN